MFREYHTSRAHRGHNYDLLDYRSFIVWIRVLPIFIVRINACQKRGGEVTRVWHHIATNEIFLYHLCVNTATFTTSYRLMQFE